MTRISTRRVVVTGIVWGAWLAISVGYAAEPIDLAAPRIVHGRHASAMERCAAGELCRYLAGVSGRPAVIGSDDALEAGRQTILLLDVAGDNRLAAEIESREKIAVDVATLGEDGFRWKATTCRGQPALLVAAARPTGVMYGVYQLLDKLGFGFYLGGDTFPARGTPLVVSPSLDEVRKPVFAVRGTLPWGNLLNAYWDLDDWKFYFDQLAKQGYNFVGFHQYCSPMQTGGQPWCAFPWKGTWIGGDPMRSSLNEIWARTDRGMKTEQFGFGTGDYYDRDPFTERATLEGKNREDKLRRTQKALAEAMNYAHTRGIKVCLGFGIGDDPTAKEYEERLEAMIASMLKNYPMLDYVWFFQEENQGQAGWKVQRGSEQERLAAAGAEPFKYLGAPERVAEGARLSYVCRMVYRIVKKYRRDLPVIINGWGGDCWMHCSDYYLGLEKTLPKDVIFGCQDNLYPQSEPNVSKVYGQLPRERNRWPIPWWNNDGYSLWDPQCTTRWFVPICRDVYAKKCQGMLAIHWLTREVEEVAAYQAQFAWDPAITYEGFYDRFAERCYGKPWAEGMSRIHRELESLGPRWTGASGETELGPVAWTTKNHTGKTENRRKLAEIKKQLEEVRREMLGRNQLNGIERIEWLLTTIDWLTRYDDACLKMSLDGPFGALLRDAEAAHAKGDAGAARQKAEAARQIMLRSGLREAIQTYPRKMSAMSEFGQFASIQVKSYAYYLSLWERLKKILGPVPDDLGGPPVPADTPPLLVGKHPRSVIDRSRDSRFSINVVAMGGAPIASCTLNYRTIGDANWKQAAMRPAFRRTYAASIGATDLKGRAIQWYVEAVDRSQRVAHWPKGYPSVVWSATIVQDSCETP